MEKEELLKNAVHRKDVVALLCRETCTPGPFCPDGGCIEIRRKVDALPSILTYNIKKEE